MAAIYNPWADPETEDTLTGQFATPDLLTSGQPLDSAEDASDPAETAEPDNTETESAAEDAPEQLIMMQVVDTLQKQNDTLQMLMTALTDTNG